MSQITFGKDRFYLNGAMEKWCKEHIGPGGWIHHDTNQWNISSIFGNTTFTFNDEKHLTWFVLRWS